MGDFDKPLGPLLLGIFLNTYLYGIIMLQYVSYRNTRISDTWWIKYPTEVLFVINTFHCAVSIYMAWYYCVKSYVDPDATGAGFWANAATLICIAIIGLVAHMFLAYRFYRLTQNVLTFSVFFLASVTVFAISLSAGIVSIKHNLTLNQMISHQSDSIFENLVLIWLVLQTFLEAGLAVGVGYALLRCKPPFMPATRHSSLIRVFRGFVQSGGAVFLFSLADLISYIADRTTTVFVMFSLSVAPLYSILIFDTLLARRVSLASPEINSVPGNDPSGIWFPTIPKTSAAESATNQNISLRNIHVRTEVLSDSVRLGTRQRSLDGGCDDLKTPNVI